MRLPYTANPPSPKNSEETGIIARVLERRGATGLTAIDLTQLHAPLIADGFNSYFKALRTQNGLPAQIRELCFCRVATLAGASYEWDIHALIAKEASLSERVLEELKQRTLGSQEMRDIDARARAVVAYADAMTLQIQVPDALFEQVREYFDPKEMVELTNSIAGFNSVVRLVVALDIGERNK